MHFRQRFWLLATGMIATFGMAGAPAAPIPGEQFDKLHALIRPDFAAEKWNAIPWLTDLWEARRRAAETGKPILLWEMDGHPLGCT